jgi:hypothetical protein
MAARRVQPRPGRSGVRIPQREIRAGCAAGRKIGPVLMCRESASNRRQIASIGRAIWW